MITPHRSWLRCRIICWLSSAHIGHILTLNNAEGLNLYFRLLQRSPVWSREERALIVHWGLCHIHLKSGPFSLLTDTLNDGPQTIQNRSLYAHKCSTFRQTTVRPPPLPLLFRYLHISERCGGHKRYSQLSFSLILWNGPILKLLFVQSLSLTPLMPPPSARHCLSTGCCKKATN